MQYETPKDPRSSLVRLNPIKYLAASKGRLLWLLLCLKIARWHWHCLGHQFESGHSRLDTSLKRLFMADIKTFKNVFLNSEKNRALKRARSIWLQRIKNLKRFSTKDWISITCKWSNTKKKCPKAEKSFNRKEFKFLNIEASRWRLCFMGKLFVWICGCVWLRERERERERNGERDCVPTYLGACWRSVCVPKMVYKIRNIGMLVQVRWYVFARWE